MQNNFTIAGLGEVLWDIDGNHRSLGGAPANFSCLCRGLGANALIMSCVGNDPLGMECQEILTANGLDLSCLSVSEQYPTGTVNITLDSAGHPSYAIKEDVAWDHIPFTPEMEQIAPSLDAVCFGTLSQRNADSRNTITRILDSTRADCLRLFDINLRLDYYSPEIIKNSLAHATALKVNDEELPLLSEMFQLQGDEEDQLKALTDQFDLKLAILTCGSKGAWMVTTDSSNFTPSTKLSSIASTVGAGDAFTATAVMGFLRQHDLATINQHANAVASYICTQPSAVAALPSHLITYSNQPTTL